jgi:glucans biosynthesis protein C
VTSARHGGLDALRALAMLLGLAYHATYAYVPEVGPWYPVADAAHAEGFRVLAGVLHAVRMPVFFALAGFFAHLGLSRRSRSGYLADRARRLLIPFAVALPLSLVADVAVRSASQRAGLMDPAYAAGTALRFSPMHLWFLEVLFLCCVGAAAVGPPRAWRPSRWALGLLALGLGSVTAGVGALHGELRPDASLVPDPASLAVFGCFFAFGVALGAAPRALPRSARWLAPVGLALALFVHTRHLQWEPAGFALDAVAAWLVTVGALEAALAVGPVEAPWARPLVDAAYFVYLVHYPLVGALQVALGPTSLPAVVKYAAVVLGALGLSAAAFWAGVHDTWLAPWLGARTPASRGCENE